MVYFQVAKLVASEFFEQGDIEREKLKITPIVSISAISFLFSFFSILFINVRNSILIDILNLLTINSFNK